MNRASFVLTCSPRSFISQIRTLVVLKHRFPPFLAKEGEKPRLIGKNYVYDIVDVDTTHKLPPIDCILTGHVDGLGERGDLVSVKRWLFRHDLYPSGLAVYASPDNIAEFEKEAEATKHIPKLSRFAYLTWLQLWGIHLDIPMSGEETWTLDKSHVRIAFRLAGLEIDESCLTLPDDAVTSPCDINIIVNVNGIKEATVPATIYPIYKDPNKNIDREKRAWLSREDCYKIIQQKNFENRTESAQNV